MALLMGIRDERIDRIVEFFGPTDFFDVFVQDVVEEALLGSLRDLPALDFLNEELIQPLRRGELTIPQVRPELVRRSPVLFADRLPPLQMHHGDMDDVVEVSQAQSLIAAIEASSSCAPQPKAQPPPPAAQAPNPTLVISSPERPRRRVGRVISRLRRFASPAASAGGGRARRPPRRGRSRAG